MMPSSMPPPPAPTVRKRAAWRPALDSIFAFARSFSEVDSESASKKSRGRQRAELWLFYNWRWLLPLLVTAVAVAYMSLRTLRSEVAAVSEAAQAAEEGRASALEMLLAAPSSQLSQEAFSSGYLASGRAMAELERDLREHMTAKDLMCASAKHVSASDHLIVVGKIAMWNSRTLPAPDAETTKEPESSDFFADLPPIKVERPSSSYVEYRESGGAQRRIKASGGTLRCIMHCQEVLSGAHLTKFVEAQRAAAAKKMRKG